jgi:hypothetical protein
MSLVNVLMINIKYMLLLCAGINLYLLNGTGRVVGMYHELDVATLCLCVQVSAFAVVSCRCQRSVVL